MTHLTPSETCAFQWCGTSCRMENVFSIFKQNAAYVEAARGQGKRVSLEVGLISVLSTTRVP